MKRKSANDYIQLTTLKCIVWQQRSCRKKARLLPPSNKKVISKHDNSELSILIYNEQMDKILKELEDLCNSFSLMIISFSLIQSTNKKIWTHFIYILLHSVSYDFISYYLLESKCWYFSSLLHYMLGKYGVKKKQKNRSFSFYLHF